MKARFARDDIKQDLIRASKSLSEPHGPALDGAFGGDTVEPNKAAAAENRLLSHAEIERLRSKAISKLKAYIRKADVRADVPEDGAYAVLDARTGKLSYFCGPEAGEPRGTGYFDFKVSTSTPDEFIAGFAHSHPLVTSAKSRDPDADNRRNKRLSREDRAAMLGFTSEIDPTGLGSVAILKNWKGDIICERPDGRSC